MKTQQGLQAIQSLDLDVIKRRMMSKGRGPGWSQERTEAAIEGYLAYLELAYLQPDHSTHPTEDVDEVWHKHMLDSVKYRADCAAIFGYYLDHIPCDDAVVVVGVATCGSGTGQGSCGKQPGPELALAGMADSWRF